MSSDQARGAEMFCPACGLRQPVDHRFCVSCGSGLPRDLLRRGVPKVTRWFWTIPVTERDPEQAALRVSRYLEEFDIATDEGTARVPSHHVRFSIWVGDQAVCAVSLPDHEAERLAQFLLAWIPESVVETAT